MCVRVCVSGGRNKCDLRGNNSGKGGGQAGGNEAQGVARTGPGIRAAASRGRGLRRSQPANLRADTEARRNLTAAAAAAAAASGPNIGAFHFAGPARPGSVPPIVPRPPATAPAVPPPAASAAASAASAADPVMKDRRQEAAVLALPNEIGPIRTDSDGD